MNPENKKPDLDQIASNMEEQIEIFVEAANPIVDLHEQIDKEAKGTVEQAKILAQAQNAIDNAAEPEPAFVPSKDNELLFDQINAIVQSQNLLDQGTLEADHHWRHLERDHNPGQYNPEAVIDEKIKEEQKENEEQDLRNEIVDAL